MPQYFDSTAAFPMKTKKRVYASGGRVGLVHGGPHNTGRMNLLEEEGRIRSEPQTRNVRAEEGRVIGELNRGYNKGGRVGLKKGGKAKKQGYIDRKDESIAMRIRKPRTKEQLRASADESYGKFGSAAKKSGQINR